MKNKSKKIKIYAENLDNETMTQFYEAMKLDCNVQGALMPDSHAGYTLPIGAVIKSNGKIFPSYVGYDIGCGMCAIKTNIKAETLSKEDLIALKEKVIKLIPTGKTRHLDAKKINVNEPATKLVKNIFNNTGVYQLGTLGGGNHFIEVGKGEDDFVNIIIHSGSRNLGKQVAEFYMKEAAIQSIDEKRYIDEFNSAPKNVKWMKSIQKGKSSIDTYNDACKEFVYRRTRARFNTNIEGHYGLDINSEKGKEYIMDMNFALEYALANRKEMVQQVVNAMGDVLNIEIKTERFINRNHNHAEMKNGFVIHRKGATHADKGMYGVIPGNMKDGSFIVIGKGCEASMNSSSHGAGRVLSRRKAKDTLDLNTFHKSMEGIITNHTDGTLDEAPLAYKNIFEVMELQEDLVEVVERVTPLLNIKG